MIVVVNEEIKQKIRINHFEGERVGVVVSSTAKSTLLKRSDQND